MTDRMSKVRHASSRERLRVTHPHAAGIDIHANVHWVAVPPADAPPPPPDQPPNVPVHVRSFGACTADLIALADWLAECGIQIARPILEWLGPTGVLIVGGLLLIVCFGSLIYAVVVHSSRQAPGRLLWPFPALLQH